ncbi:MAG: aminodeoxychorismate lyase [Bacillota bacterium]|nr:aminodeoxychorismate lyase [Bacillota bacterium]
MYLNLNGKIIKKEEAMISPFDHGFLYGAGVFETFRVYGNHCFLLDDHLERLNKGLEALNIERQFTRCEAEAMVQSLLEANRYKDAYIRFNVSAGIGEIGLRSAPYTQPTIIVFSKPLSRIDGTQEKEATILLLNRNTPEGRERLKSHHYLNNLFAWRELGGLPGNEGVFLTKEGFLAEGIVSNLFWVKGTTLYTPSLQTGILNGITRTFVIELAKKHGLAVEEGLYYPEEAHSADEIFLTNSIQELTAVSRFADRELPGSKGKIVKLLHGDYQTYSSYLYSRMNL